MGSILKGETNFGNCSLVEKIFLTKYYLSIILNHKYKNGEEKEEYA
ncbi:MAG: hypothetical protein HFI03_11345 [Lachnospiraceae bacterium]|nr:hypothetical protein [Lachnospiraceae bacterium]